MLFELRTRLMADIVTGKLDVREAAQNLPDEEVRLESLDETEVSDEEGSLTDSDGLEPEESEA